MSRPDFQSVQQYLDALSPEALGALEQVRATLHQAFPGAEEGISYQIPCLRWRGVVALYFAGYARHVGVYPVTAGVQAALGERLAPHLSGKATLRFPLDAPLPLELILAVGQARAAEIGEGKAKRSRAPSKG
ncbi:DUF1801 domain-containing protein [Myxococcota bacterium]|nr:DUF1801 domain-containing protein [Myxococcota bacterium]